jgi:ubiquinone/menaquinone biosynthesis C-methylase UbiE
VKILDVGGTPDFWITIGVPEFADITMLNLEESLLSAENTKGFSYHVGDARDLSAFADGEFDVVVSNSVIEHVGGWADIKQACKEMQRVGRSGWVQTPAASFPIEPHFVIPFIHYFSASIRAFLLYHLPRRGYENLADIGAARSAVEAINLLSKKEVSILFPDSKVVSERFLGIAKSNVALWGEMFDNY